MAVSLPFYNQMSVMAPAVNMSMPMQSVSYPQPVPVQQMSLPQIQTMPAFSTQQASFVPTQTASMPAVTNHNNGNIAFDPNTFMAQRQALSSQPLIAPYQQQAQQQQQQQQSLPRQAGGEAYGALVPYQEKDQKQTSVQLAAETQQQSLQDPSAAGRTREERMYLATVSELSKVIHTKYRASLVHKRAAPETVGFLIHRHCEALRMLGHVAENIIQHTNAILDDPSLQVEHIKDTLGGGDEQLLSQACEWVRSLIIIFQKEAITIHFPWYLPRAQYMAEQQMQQQRQIQMQQEQRRRAETARDEHEEKEGGCTIM